MAKKKKIPLPLCIHADKADYAVITPGQHLKPIGGKIYWHIDEDTLTKDMDKYKTVFAFDQAFKKWQTHFYPIILEPTGDKSKSQITIFFKHNGDVGLPHTFSNGVLAYAFAPNGESLGMHADMYFNDGYSWAEMHKYNSIYLFKVAVHEIGHAFNISHQTNDKTDIMYPQYQPNDEVLINKDNQKAIYDLYKQYGVQLAGQPEVQPSAPNSNDLKLFIRSLFKSKGDIARLSLNQINTFGAILGINFLISDKPQNRIDKIWAGLARL